MNASTKSCMCEYSSHTVAEFWKEFETSTDNAIPYVTLVSHNLAVRYRHKHMVCNECGGHEAVLYEDEMLLAPSSSIDIVSSEDEAMVTQPCHSRNFIDDHEPIPFPLVEIQLTPSSSVDRVNSEDEAIVTPPCVVDVPTDSRNFMEDDREPIPLVGTPFYEILKFDEGDLL